MHILVDKNEKTVGYLYNNVILLPGLEVAGVLLAHCVYAQHGEIKGKFFKSSLYNPAGQIIARERKSEPFSLHFDDAIRIAREAWEILSRTKNHICPWVVSTNEWSHQSLREFLLQKSPSVV